MAPVRGIPEHRRAIPVGRLMRHLALSLLFCLLLAAGGVNQGSEGSITAWVVWAGGIAVFWLVFAALQVRWWAKGYDHFMRPVYVWALTGLVVIGLLGLPLVLLLWPRVRRWLLLQVKPFNPSPSASDEGDRTSGVPSGSPPA
jgi:hypothetical protein